jgi:hypothetical protein
MEAKQLKLDEFLFRTIKKYDKFKQKHNGDNLIQRFLQGLLQELDENNSIIHYRTNDDQSLVVSYTRFYQVSKTVFKDIIKELTNEEIGLFCYLCLHIGLYNNMLIASNKNIKPLASKDLMVLLELSNEKTKELLEKLTRNKLIIYVKHRPTNALFVNPEFAIMKASAQGFNKDYNQNLEHLKFKTPIMINHEAIKSSLFNKNNRLERISHGKRTLGTLIQIALKMNDKNEIKIGQFNESTLLDLICVKTGVDVLSKVYIQTLIDHHYIILRNELIIINPYFAQYTRNRKFSNITLDDVNKLRNMTY